MDRDSKQWGRDELVSMRIPSVLGPRPAGLTMLVDGSSTNLIRFGLLRLGLGEFYAGNTDDDEVALVVLGGHCNVTVDDYAWPTMGGRASVFGGAPFAAYVPKGSEFEVTGVNTGCEIALVRAPARKRYRPRVVTPDELVDVEQGTENRRFTVRDVIGANVEADRLVVGETYSEPGHWAAYSPRQDGASVDCEKVAHYRLYPGRGFAFQWVYDPEAGVDDTHTVREGDTMLMRRGHHAVAAAPGYHLYTLWALAGEHRPMPSPAPVGLGHSMQSVGAAERAYRSTRRH